MKHELDFWLRAGAGGAWFLASCAYGIGLCLKKPGDANIPHEFARFLHTGTSRAMRLRIELEGAEHLTAAQPCIYLPNHQSNLDIVLYSGLYPPRTIVIGKREVAKIPLFGWFFARSGNVLIDRKDRKAAIAGLDSAVRAMHDEGKSIWMFPEGTRNKAGGGTLLPFKKGPFHMAIAAQRPIVPIVASSLEAIVDKAGHHLHGGTVRVRVLPPIPTAGLGEGDVEALLQRTRAAMLEALAQAAPAATPAAAARHA